MKPIINRLTGYTTFFFMPMLLLKKRHVLIFLAAALIAAGCFQKFYSTGTTKEVTQEKISEVSKMNKIFILHYGDATKALIAEQLRTENDVLTGSLKPLDKAHSKALAPSKESNVVAGKSLPAVLNEVHIYTKESIDPQSTSFSIPLSSVYRMDVYEFDEKATKRSTTWSIIGIVAAVAVVAVTAVIAISGASAAVEVLAPVSVCGCPEVYVEQQGQYQYVNGVFSGALYSNMERSDYLPLGDIAAANGIKIDIRSTPKEQQFLDQVELIAVQHQPGQTVMADRQGGFHVFSQEIPATMAVAENGADLKTILQAKDNELFRFNTDLQDDDLSSVVLEFTIPQGEASPLLTITGRNSGWAAAMNQSFTLLFGKEYPEWRARKEKDAPENMEKWQLEQGLPLKVSAFDGKKWTYVDYFPLSGTMAPRDMAMLINRQWVVDGKLKIKLETVFNFWEIDKASVALRADPANLRTIAFNESIDALKRQDRSYYTLDDKQATNIAISFTDPAWQERTAYFLHARGYYHNEDFYPGEADKETLRKFQDEKAFIQFSKNQYRIYQELMAARPK